LQLPLSLKTIVYIVVVLCRVWPARFKTLRGPHHIIIWNGNFHTGVPLSVSANFNPICTWEVIWNAFISSNTMFLVQRPLVFSLVYVIYSQSMHKLANGMTSLTNGEVTKLFKPWIKVWWCLLINHTIGMCKENGCGGMFQIVGSYETC